MSNRTKTRRATILLVEDNPADQKLTIRALRRGKVETDLHIAENGEEALQYLRRDGKFANEKCPLPDLILLDINMPKVDGKQVLKEIRNDPELNMLPVIMLTTSNQERDIIDSYKLGVNAYINKPVTISDFLEAIRKLEEFWLQLIILPTQAANN